MLPKMTYRIVAVASAGALLLLLALRSFSVGLVDTRPFPLRLFLASTGDNVIFLVRRFRTQFRTHRPLLQRIVYASGFDETGGYNSGHRL